MKNIILVLFITFTSICFSQNVQEKHQYAKITFNSIAELTKLSELGLAIDHGININHNFVQSDFSVSEIEVAKNAGYSVEILIEDSKEYFLQQNKLQKINNNNPSCIIEDNYQTPINFELGFMGGYLTYQEMLNELDEMKALYPNLITTKENISNFLTEGQADSSTTPPIGGNGIKWVKISDHPNNSSEGEPQILYTAVHHAREPTSLSQLIFYMWYLLENYETDLEIKNIIDHTELYFVPVVNPDGYLYNEKTDPDGGGFWRKNRKNGDGVDNNRNYNYFINGNSNDGIWGGVGSSSDPTSNIYRGTAPFSEIENQAIKWFVEQHNFIIGINNHSFGNGLFFPYAYDADAFTPDHNLYETFLEELVSKNDYIYQKSAGLSGLAMDFMYGTVGTHNKIITFTPEIGSSFWLPSDEIIPVCKEMMYVNITSARMITDNVIIEDIDPIFVGNSTVVDFNFSVLNISLSETNNYTISINPISNNIIATGPPLNLTNLNSFEESIQTFQYTLLSPIEEGDAIVYELIIDNGIYENKYLINKKFGEIITIITDPGESISTNFENNGWGVTTEDFISSPSSITDSPNENYENNTTKTITLKNQIDLSNAIRAFVQFNAKWEIQNNSDYVQFEVSIDNGTSWIAQCGAYTNDGSNNGIQPKDEPVYDDIQNEWVLEEIDLSDYLGETIKLRFKFESDTNGTLDGFYFDDFEVKVVGDAVLNTTTNYTVDFSIYPNPVNNLLIINTTSTNYSVDIYTIQGQLVTQIKNVSATQTIDFSVYTTGIYFMRIISDNITKTMKVVKE